jgi:uracil-DNA glycosylase family 4
MTGAGTLALDARQCAMLDEMGVKVWWPVAPVPAPPVAIETIADSASQTGASARFDVENEVQARPSAPARSPLPRSAESTAPIASAPAAPRAAATSAMAGDAVLVEAPRLLFGDAAAQGGWLIVADMPPGPDGRHGEPLDGDAGRLLANMLRALQLHGGAVPVHLMRAHRGPAASASAPSAPRPFDDSFAAHASAVAPRLVLAMGPLAAQSLLQRAEPLGKLRGHASELAHLPGVTVVATYHPAYLLRNPADKARAWADLCLAAAQFD